MANAKNMGGGLLGDGRKRSALTSCSALSIADPDTVHAEKTYEIAPNTSSSFTTNDYVLVMLESENYTNMSYNAITSSTAGDFVSKVYHVQNNYPCPCLILKSDGTGGTSPAMEIDNMKNPNVVGTKTIYYFSLMYGSSEQQVENAVCINTDSFIPGVMIDNLTVTHEQTDFHPNSDGYVTVTFKTKTEIPTHGAIRVTFPTAGWTQNDLLFSEAIVTDDGTELPASFVNDATPSILLNGFSTAIAADSVVSISKLRPRILTNAPSGSQTITIQTFWDTAGLVANQIDEATVDITIDTSWKKIRDDAFYPYSPALMLNSQIAKATTDGPISFFTKVTGGAALNAAATGGGSPSDGSEGGSLTLLLTGCDSGTCPTIGSRSFATF